MFFTRWVTHFCAPVFVFLAGTGAFFNGRELGDPSLLAGVIWMLGWCMILIAALVRFSTVRIADRIAVIADGHVTELGTHDELLRAGGRYAELFELQAAGYR